MAKIRKVLASAINELAIKAEKMSKTAKSEKFKAHQTSLQPGQKAPDFKGLNQDGAAFSLADYKGKKLILYFYPKDNTATCTVESCNLQENLNSLRKDGYDVVGVSADDVKSHRKFADKFGLKFNLLADTEMKAIKDYDVWGLKMFMGRIFEGILRTTFVINEKGIIEHVITAVTSKDHANQIRNL